MLGTAYLYAKDYDAAQREFEGLLKTKPNDMTAKLMLGAVLVGKGACSKAITLYERILPEAPKQPSIYYNLGTCYLREKRSADAQREAELYTKAKPTDAKGYVLAATRCTSRRTISARSARTSRRSGRTRSTAPSRARSAASTSA